MVTQMQMNRIVFFFCNDPLNATTRHTRSVQAFAAADIMASWLLFLTTGVLSGTFTIPGHTFHFTV